MAGAVVRLRILSSGATARGASPSFRFPPRRSASYSARDGVRGFVAAVGLRSSTEKSGCGASNLLRSWRLGRRAWPSFLSSSSPAWILSAGEEIPRGTDQRRFYGSVQTVPLYNNISDYPPHTLFPMPALSPTMETGSIASWSKAEGDEFAAGDVLCTIDTDKASVDFESQDDGILAKILHPGGTGADLKVGTPICVVVEETEDVAAFADYVAAVEDDSGSSSAASGASPTDNAAASNADPAPAPSTTRQVGDEFVLMPAARHLSESKGLDATVLDGSGKGGRVTKGDVLRALADGVALPPLVSASHKSIAANTAAAPETAPPSPETTAPAAAPVAVNLSPPAEGDTAGGSTFEDLPNNKMRKIIAARLTESKRDVPHFYTSVEVELDSVLALRKKLANEHDVKVSVNDFVIRCCALALRDVPEVNGTYDAAQGTVKLQESVDVSVAVATPTGLITPIVFGADRRGLSEIADTVRDLATRARDGQLAPHEYQGGTFSVSNLGMFGMSEFSAVINPPQAAILAIGSGVRTVCPSPAATKDGDEKAAPGPSVKTLMTGRLSADRRVVDEATASLFLSAFRHYVNEPQLLLL